ncbi:unnamed protein product [Rotaria magnacalcarata]
MQFESLSNELLLDLFEFFDGVHLFGAFYGLNNCFNTLLLVHCLQYHFDFQLLSKRKFDLICQEYLPSIIDRVTSIRLSDSDETPNLVDRFLITYGFNFTQFTHLYSLSLIQVGSLEKISAILTEFSDFAQPTRLQLMECFYRQEDDLTRLINNIWHLPKLTHCEMDINKPYSILLFRRLSVSRGGTLTFL